jgi:hypothetical protein
MFKLTILIQSISKDIFNNALHKPLMGLCALESDTYLVNINRFSICQGCQMSQKC